MVFLPHTNTVLLLEPYCGTMTEPGLPVVSAPRVTANWSNNVNVTLYWNAMPVPFLIFVIFLLLLFFNENRMDVNLDFISLLIHDLCVRSRLYNSLWKLKLDVIWFGFRKWIDNYATELTKNVLVLFSFVFFKKSSYLS